MIPAFDINITAKKAELAILKTLVYFDIFDYPLSQKDIKSFLECHLPDEALAGALRQLISDRIIFKTGEFYSLRNNLQKAEKRLQGNLRAQKLLPRASKIGAFLYKFPFVRAVAVSGSLSKNYADEKADIDFFIIAKENRLWIARTILHLFKKLTFLIGRQHFYCMNYFIDEKALIIPERNIYTAMEVVTLMPLAGNYTMNKFFEVNSWTEKWFPEYKLAENLRIFQKESWFKRFTERFLNKRRGDRLDDFLFTLTTRRWQKKAREGRKNSKGKVMNLITGKHFSKSNPEAFQEKVVAMYQNKIDQLENAIF